jgi:hypothetical protein
MTSSILGSIFGFGNRLKSGLRNAAENPGAALEMMADRNRNNWKENPDQQSMGFFNPVPLGTMGNFVLQKKLGDAATNLSRRDFLQKSGGLAAGAAAASIPGSKLLQKFAPEERALVKEAVTEAAPKYKYNSLSDYLKDTQKDIISKTNSDFSHLPGRDPYTGAQYESVLNSRMRDRLLDDEAYYRSAKDMFKPGGTRDPAVYNIPEGYKASYKSLDDFSPQAKKEMSEYKDFVKQYRGEEHWSRPDDMQEWIDGVRIPF